MNILVVEDENAIREFVVAYLKQAGHESIEAINGEEALNKFKSNKIDLVLLDINIPKVDGITLCRTIRQNSMVPIIMVTARVEEIDELIGLEVGADDYIKKPFSPAVLVARVNSLLRRFSPEKLERGDLSIDPEKRVVHIQEKELNLTTTQFNILYTLAQRPGKVFTRTEIMDRAYEDNVSPDIFDRTVDAHIKSIRKAIETDPSQPRYILTVIGRGYKFNDRL
jgi:DNA-binding response OmpR family regulator